MPLIIVNVIPQTGSAETNFDSEPNITVNPRNPQQIVLTAFTPDTAPGTTTGPYFYSANGGQTWAQNSVIPGGTSTFGTKDISVRFGPATSTLYAGILRGDSSLRLNILRKANFSGPGSMEVLVDRADDDQPWVETSAGWDNTAGGLVDRVYVSSNDISRRPTGDTATVDMSMNPATAAPPANFVTRRLEVRNSAALPSPPGGSQDGPSVRSAPHRSGTVYGAFLGWRTFGTLGNPNVTDVVVVRDDDWGSSAAPFSALSDPPSPAGDGLVGRRVVRKVSVAPLGTSLGTQRIGSSLMVAVDPRNRRRVYLAWCDGLATAASPYTVHVCRSDDGGATWTADLRTVANATNPALAVTTRGVVGLMYQQFATVSGVNRWRTHLEISIDRMATVANDFVLADVRDSNVGATITVVIGDYCNLTAAGKDLYGAFSAFNEPIAVNFPNGVTYQRNVDWPSNQLRAVDGTTVVNASVDPFFVVWTPIQRHEDFYVRDWTDSPSSGDDGLEPSLRPAFYVTSDVWNRRGTNPGSFPNDQPDNEPAGNGVGKVGDNYAFARIRRRAAAPSGTPSVDVSTHFLVSPLGTGSNFLDATDMDPDVSIPPGDPVTTFSAGDVGPITVGPLAWHLNPVASTHLCLAVEITAPNDPIAGQSLRGRAPGWPDQDLEVLEDNNKAQRNMGLSITPARGAEASLAVLYALVHNASLRTRDLMLSFATDEDFQAIADKATLRIVGGEAIKRPISGTVVLDGMLPGEHRWLGIEMPAAAGKAGDLVRIFLEEIVDGQPVSGFGLGLQLGTQPDVTKHLVARHRSVFTRIAAMFDDDRAETEAKLTIKAFPESLRSHLDRITTISKDVLDHTSSDAFEVGKALTALRAAARKSATSNDTMVLYGALLERLDATLTDAQLAKGNRGDLLQNVQWQIDLLTPPSALGNLDARSRIRRPSAVFAQRWADRQARDTDYTELLETLLPALKALADAAGVATSEALIDVIREELDHPVRAQHAHRQLLLALHALAWPATPSATPAKRRARSNKATTRRKSK